MRRVAIIGAGSWGTALAIALSRKDAADCPEVRLWGRDAEAVSAMREARENRKYLAGHPFPEALHLTSDLAQALEDADCVFMVVPSHGFRQVFRAALPLLKTGIPVVSAVKGIEIDSCRTMTRVMAEESGDSGEYGTSGNNDKALAFCVLSGPSFAEETAAGHPTAVTVACRDLDQAIRVQRLFAGTTLRVYSSSDVAGLEISGAMKNVIALAAGISDGLGYGLNTRAALITRGLAEITRLGLALGADARTFAGLAGLGDLVLTCTGNLSRNRTVGLALGKGGKLAEILAEMHMVAEGVRTTASCFKLAKEAGVEMPILEQTYAVLYEDRRPEEAVARLVRRDLKSEVLNLTDRMR